MPIERSWAAFIIPTDTPHSLANPGNQDALPLVGVLCHPQLKGIGLQLMASSPYQPNDSALTRTRSDAWHRRSSCPVSMAATIPHGRRR